MNENLEECVHFENKEIENCINCKGFGVITKVSFNKKIRNYDCEFYEPKSDYLGMENDN